MAGSAVAPVGRSGDWKGQREREAGDAEDSDGCHGDKLDKSEGKPDEMLRILKPRILHFEVDPRDTFARRMFGRRGAAVIWRLLQSPWWAVSLMVFWVCGSSWMLWSLVEDIGYPYLMCLNLVVPFSGVLQMNVCMFKRTMATFETKFVLFNVLGVYMGIAYVMQDVHLAVAWLAYVPNMFTPLFNDALPQRMRRLSASLYLPFGIAFAMAVVGIFITSSSRAQVVHIDLANGARLDVSARIVAGSAYLAVFQCKNLWSSRRSRALTVAKSTFESVKVSRKAYEDLRKAHDIIINNVHRPESPRRPKAGHVASVAPISTVVAPGPPAQAAGGQRTSNAARLRSIVCIECPVIIRTDDTLGKLFLPDAVSRLAFNILLSPIGGWILFLSHVFGDVCMLMSTFNNFTHLWWVAVLLLMPIPTLIWSVLSRAIFLRLVRTFEVLFLCCCAAAVQACVALLATDWRHGVAFIPVTASLFLTAFSDAIPQAALPCGRVLIAFPSLIVFGFFTLGTFGQLLDSQSDFVIRVMDGWTVEVRDTLGGLCVTCLFFMLRSFSSGDQLVVLKAKLFNITFESDGAVHAVRQANRRSLIAKFKLSNSNTSKG